MSLAQHHAACYEAFQRACAISDGRELPELPDQFDRYKLWAGNVGAAHSGHTYTLSLDYRLREASFYREQVVQLLVILCRHIDKAAQLLSGERTPFEEFPLDETPETANLSSDRRDSPLSESGDSPWEISSDSESDASSEPGSQRDPSIQPAPDEEDTDWTSGGGLQELPQTLQSIKLTVSSLFKLPIRRPAPIDRLNDRATDETSCFQPFDVMYVKDKFPCLEEELAIRLGNMITQRRQLLLYRKRHWQNLRTEMSATLHHHHENEEGINTQKNLESGDNTDCALRSSMEEESRHDTSRIPTTSKATTMKINDGPLLHPEHLSVPPMVQPETITSIQASEHTRQLRLNVPPRPKDHLGTVKDCFQCPYCHLVQMGLSERAWRRHVLADLQPYVCTFLHCNLPDHFFQNRETWYEHETHHHRIELFCNTPGHFSYTNQTDFEEHIRMDHGAEMGAKLPTSLFAMFMRPLRSSEMTCNLCFRKTKSLKSHVARHLEQISLFALPRADYFEDDEDIYEGSNVAQNNGQESQTDDLDVDDAETQSTLDTGGQVSRPDEAHSFCEDAERVVPVRESLELEEPKIPDAEGLIWDFVTDKFSQARNGLSDAAPSGLIPVQANQNLPSTADGRLSPRARFREAVKAITRLHRHRKINRTHGTFQKANCLLVDATAGHPSQKETMDRLENVRTVFAQRFADYWPIIRIVDKDTGLLRHELLEEGIKDILKFHSGPETVLFLVLIGPHEAAVEVLDASEPKRSLAEVLFKSVCKVVGGKSPNIILWLDSGNPWINPPAAPNPMFKMKGDVTNDFDEVKWTFPMAVACRPGNSTTMSQSAPFTGVAMSVTLRLLDKGRTYILRDLIDGMNAKLPKGQKVILLGLDRDRFQYTCLFTPRTMRTGSLNLPFSRSAHITILLVNVACTAWLLALYRRRLAQFTPLSHSVTEEPKDKTATEPRTIKPLGSREMAMFVFQKWRLISRIRRLEKRLIQTRVLFLWRINPTNSAANTDKAPSVRAADDAELGGYRSQAEATDCSQGRGSASLRAKADFGTPLAEQAVASVIEKGFSISEAEFALAHTSSEDGQISVERALKFLDGLS